MSDKLSDAFGIEPIEREDKKSTKALKPIEKVNEIAKPEPIEKVAIDDDVEYVRGNIRNLIDKGSDALDDLLWLAKSTEHPRVYEVLSQLLKTISDQNKDLIDINQKTRPKEETQPATQIQNAMFIGSTADFLKALKGDNNE